MIHPISVLLVDNDQSQADDIVDVCNGSEFQFEQAFSSQEAIRLLSLHEYDIVLVNIGPCSAHEYCVIDHIKSRNIKTIIIVVSEDISREGAIAAIKAGAFDYFEKPYETESLSQSLRRAMDRLTLDSENKRVLRELQKLNSMKNEFLSILSHDIRSPLSSIGGFAGYLLKKGNLNDLQQHYLEIIQQISENLYSLVNEVLDISKIEKGIIELSKEETNLEELVNASINNFILLAVDKNNRIEFYNSLSDMVLYIDRMKMLQVFNNLISNANKFTEDGRIIISLAERQSGEIAITVRDTGLGMDDSELTQLIDHYRYYHRCGTRGEKGNGLGIIICRQFIELHGGHLEVVSEKGKGSSFTILLPAKS